MGITIGMNQAKALLADGVRQAQELVKDPSKVDDLLIQLEDKLREVPAVGETLANLPLTVALVKSYITREYTEVSPKVILSLIGSFIYLVKKKDLVSDDLPVIGLADDIAVLALGLKGCEPELQAFAEWRRMKGAEPVRAAEEACDISEAEAEEYAEAVAEAEAWAEAEEEGDPEI